MVNDLQRARELTIQANNSTMSASDKKSVAVELASIFDSLVAAANTQDASGAYILLVTSSMLSPSARRALAQRIMVMTAKGLCRSALMCK